MKQVLFVFLFCFCVVLTAQENNTQSDASLVTEVFNARVLYESAFVRSLPSEEAEALASVFENDILEAIGRNVDGTWIQVRRPYREISLGWIARHLLVYSFSLSELPITDLTTGLIGTEPVVDTGFSVYILTEAALRTEPFFDSEQLAVVPVMLTLPVLERNADARWLKVNYLGIVGWISSFNISSTDDLSQVPISADFAPEAIVVEIIPPNIQLAQAYRMRDYVQPLYDIADDLVNFWGGLLAGETLPCEPPIGNYTMISISQRDLYELPELRRAARLLPIALDDLNASVDMMKQCRVFSPNETSTAYANAINARSIFNSTLQQMASVETLLLPQIETGE